MATSIIDHKDRDGGSSSSSSSWQGRLLESSILGVIRITSTNDDDDTTDFFAGGGSNGPIDNTSYQSFCGGGHVEDNDLFCIPCPDNDRQQPLWWLVLRWLKMMLFKVVRTYTGKPILLMMLPLCVGLCIGYFIGCTSHGGDDDSNKAQRRRKTRTQQQSQNPNHWKEQQRECFTATGRPSSIFTTIAIWIWDSILFLVYLRSFIPLKQVNLSADDGQHHSAHDPIPISSSTKVATITTENGIVDANHCEKQEEKAAEMRLRLALDGPNLRSREDTVRTNLLRDDCVFESGIVDARRIPKHVAVIMDGNRRYGREVYGNATKGHWDGSSKLVDFAKWCIAERIDVLTVYAFSTENWNRSPDEVAALMSIFSRYCDELRVEALKRNIKILVLSTDVVKIPSHVQRGMERMVKETENCTGLTMNICISYGSRGEIVAASKSLVSDVSSGELDANSITEDEFQKRLLTSHCGGDPDVLIRTSGEVRISNFLLWQLAYTEMFFIDKPWPAIEKDDLLEVIRAFADGRKRRFGI